MRIFRQQQLAASVDCLQPAIVQVRQQRRDFNVFQMKDRCRIDAEFQIPRLNLVPKRQHQRLVGGPAAKGVTDARQFGPCHLVKRGGYGEGDDPIRHRVAVVDRDALDRPRREEVDQDEGFFLVIGMKRVIALEPETGGQELARVLAAVPRAGKFHRFPIADIDETAFDALGKLCHACPPAVRAFLEGFLVLSDLSMRHPWGWRRSARATPSISPPIALM